MITTATATALVALLLLAIILVALGMFGITLRLVRRGLYAQPAAALRRPGRPMLLLMYVLAALHVIAGLIAAFVVPGGGIDILVVLLAMAAFYVLFASGYSLARRSVNS